MTFHEIRFPTSLSLGAMGGPERRTDIVALANGYEERNTPWAHSRRRYDAGLGLRSLDDVAALIAFFEARQGQLIGFRWKDWADFTSSTPSDAISPNDQWIGTGDDSTVAFQLIKTYRSGEVRYTRPITKPVAGSVRLSVAGVPLDRDQGYRVDLTTGLVRFDVAPSTGADIRAGYEFDVPVRFDTAMIMANVASFGAGEVPDVPVVEIRV